MEAPGIRGKTRDWFASYLTGGHQSVDWDGVRSRVVRIQFGVLQGSILGHVLYLIHVADLLDCLGVGEESNLGYADDTMVWAIGNTVDVVREELQTLANQFVAYTKGNGLALNAGKTQLLVTGTKADNLEIIMDGCLVKPSDTLELLGVKFDRSVTTRPYIEQMARDARHRAAYIVRLASHLPRGKRLQQLANSFLLGKLGYAVAAVMAPCLPGSTVPIPDLHRPVQVGIKDVARMTTGNRCCDHVKTDELLRRAGFPSFNGLVVKAVAMEAWKAFHSSDGGGGSRNLLGSAIFDLPVTQGARSSRSTTAGLVPVPL
jgi:hypothetical protein